MFSDILKKLRQESGMTQKQLAAILGVEKSSIAKYESDKGIMPSDDIKIKIADIFGVSLDFLMGRNERSEIKLDSDEIEIITMYHTLNEQGKETAMNTLRALAAYDKMIKEIKEA